MEILVTTTEVEQAKTDYQRALGILLRAQQQEAAVAGKPLLGKCFKYLNDSNDTEWWIYMAVTRQDDEGVLHGWRFQQAPEGRTEIAEETAIAPAFVSEFWIEIERSEFVTAFNALLTSMARYVTRMPA